MSSVQALCNVARLRRTGRRYCWQCPDAPGCQGTASSAGAVHAEAQEAIESWLREQLKARRPLTWPRAARTAWARGERLEVWISPNLALAVQLRLDYQNQLTKIIDKDDVPGLFKKLDERVAELGKEPRK
jgi:hypothetical protein